MKPISAVIITYNEAEKIEFCINSLKNLVSEIIVIDSYSTDETSEICTSHGAKVIQSKWEGYAKAKNLGNSHSSQQYILSIDADEVISANLTASIKNLNLKPDVAFSFNRLTSYKGKWIRHCGWYPDTKIRIFPRDKAHWEGNFVHEKLVLKEDLDIKHLSGDLLHHAFNSKEELIERTRKYSSLAHQDRTTQNKTSGKLMAFIRSVGRFFRMFFLQFGILEGSKGIDICLIAAKGVYWKYSGDF